jgi:hypothetical protein
MPKLQKFQTGSRHLHLWANGQQGLLDTFSNLKPNVVASDAQLTIYIDTAAVPGMAQV